jgi:hypothetical protein
VKVILSIVALAAVSLAGSVEMESAAAAAHVPRLSITESGIDAPGVVARVAPPRQDWETPYNGRYLFTRVYYDEGRGGFRGRGFGGREPYWAHDLPDAEYNFSRILSTLTLVRPTLDAANVVQLDQDRIFQFPILYLVEPGHWRVRQQELDNLREYLLRGGFLIIDDLDSEQMYSLERIMQNVLPEYVFQRMDGSEAVFDSFFDIHPDSLEFRGQLAYRGSQIEFWGIFEDNDKSKRMIVIAGNNGDLGEFWQFSDTGFYPVDIYNESYKVGINYIVYALTH